jgi:chorismate synthase
MLKLDFQTAGESHGQGLLALLSGIPFGTFVDRELIDAQLALRQRGYGRSSRQKLERDQVEILTGLRGDRALGGPITLWVKNADHRIESYRTLSRPRPGHADLAGALKHETQDVADVMERASARETAARVAAGAVALGLLRHFGLRVFGFTCAIGAVELSVAHEQAPDRAERRAASALLSLDPGGDAAACEAIEAARAAGDTTGGRFRVVADFLPVGLGSHVRWQERLSGRLAQALMSIPAMKAFEIGRGRDSAAIPGSAYQDPIDPGPLNAGMTRSSNNAGGLEGGMTNGQPLVLTVTMKPIPTLARPLRSVDLATGEPAAAVYERSDACSVPAAAIVGEAMTALVLLDAFLARFGGDSLAETERRFAAHRRDG